MPRLILTRHAKSSWDAPALADHDRPLNARGRRAAAALGTWFAEHGLIPELALVSTARRTRETWELMSGAWAEAPRMRARDALYHADPATIWAAIRAAPQTPLLVVSHNPGIAALAASLPDEAPEHGDFHRFPTGATLVADFQGDGWPERPGGEARASAFVVPRDLTG